MFLPADLDLRRVCNELDSLKYKIHSIGVQLGIACHKLKEFEKEDDPLSATIDYWLKGNAKRGVPCSWQSIVAALRSSQVDESGLASEIENKFCGTMEHEVVKSKKRKHQVIIEKLTSICCTL